MENNIDMHQWMLEQIDNARSLERLKFLADAIRHDRDDIPQIELQQLRAAYDVALARIRRAKTK